MRPAQRRLLLISNSTQHGGGFLEHCAEQIRGFLPPAERVLFVPYASDDHDGYASKAKEAFERIGFACDSIHEARDTQQAAREAEAFFVGGGNTFRLLLTLYEHGLLSPIREQVLAGVPYMGASAGSNVACASIMTTNDMPIVYPPSFQALGLVPFNLNPHYIEPQPGSTHMGETRETRIQEFHERNETPVVGLPEGSMLRVEGDRMLVEGIHGCVLFRRGESKQAFAPGDDLSSLLHT